MLAARPPCAGRQGVVQGDDAQIEKQQHQLRGQTRVPDPPVPHIGLPGGACDQGDKVKVAPTGAIAAAARSAIFICHTGPVKAATAIAL